MLLQTNSYIVPRERRAEHVRLLRRFRQTLSRLGCEHFEVYEQVGPNWSSGEGERYVQIMRFRDRRHQLAVQAAERADRGAQELIAEFCELINYPYQQQQGQFSVGFYQSALPVTLRGIARREQELAEEASDESADAQGDVPEAFQEEEIQVPETQARVEHHEADDALDNTEPAEPETVEKAVTDEPVTMEVAAPFSDGCAEDSVEPIAVQEEASEAPLTSGVEAREISETDDVSAQPHAVLSVDEQPSDVAAEEVVAAAEPETAAMQHAAGEALTAAEQTGQPMELIAEEGEMEIVYEQIPGSGEMADDPSLAQGESGFDALLSAEHLLVDLDAEDDLLDEGGAQHRPRAHAGREHHNPVR